ncbi:UL38 [Suid alphaherpesvirus 1]|jgi:hypothetical protein|uniref:Capsid triplex subunit 1 n=1 Tax=Suid herpesvirus 1 TaxID=10345 RepID=T2FL74_SUHV|nr:capsid triplex subunit 1 [Suid alphaherpesvirus 1]RXE87539.1 hypothetical protein EG871_14155 [Enterococcus faecium]RXF40196.1 hypothetical protein EG872_15685 [Enterococcus faecalis]AIT55763.1 VP19c [Suid alphaherpesvirus 1]AJD79506.1 minor capsid protein [Suid alphaherpesvirus 1]
MSVQIGNGLLMVVAPGTLTVGSARARLIRQVTLADFCEPQAERPGLVVLALRHPADLAGAAYAATPPGKNHRDLEEAWLALDEGGRGLGGDGIRASVVSLNFLVAAAENGDDALRAHVTTNYRDRRTAARLERFAAVLRAMIRSHVFPHRALHVLGGLLGHVTQDRLASVTCVARGDQEAARTNDMAARRSQVHVPACALMDVDRELRLGGDDGLRFVYLVFVYTQRHRREALRVHVAVSRLPELGDALSFLLAGTRVDNAIHGTDEADAPAAPAAAAAFPAYLFNDPRSARCPTGRLNTPAAEALPVWAPDMRGRATRNSCMYAAYVRLGTVERVVRRAERCGSVDLPLAHMERFTWDVGAWEECFF